MSTTMTVDASQVLKQNLEHSFFSWTKQAGLNPINVERAEGVYLYDRSGKKYIDFSSQLMNVNIGHGHPAVTEAVNRQMRELSYVAPGLITRARGELSARLAEITPGDLTKTLFTLGGAEAIENAIKIARVYTGKHKIIAQYRSYHGATYGAISASGDPRKLAVDSQQMPNVVHVENPYFYRCPWNTSSPEECGRMALANLEQVILYENPDNIAALLFEGESGSSGCIKYPAGYWNGLRKLADKYDILLIDDEVMSGFGRTGKMFGIDHFGVTPDIICMAKGLTCGYLPLGAMTVNKKIAAHFDDRALPLGLTYSAHAVSCAAALAVLDVYEKEGLIERAAERGTYIEKRMHQMAERHPSIGDFRNTGLLGCIELVKNRQTKEPTAPWNARPDQLGAMKEVAARIRKAGMFTFVKWNFIFVAPPLTISEAQIDEGLQILSGAIEAADAVVSQ